MGSFECLNVCATQRAVIISRQVSQLYLFACVVSAFSCLALDPPDHTVRQLLFSFILVLFDASIISLHSLLIYPSLIQLCFSKQLLASSLIHCLSSAFFLSSIFTHQILLIIFWKKWRNKQSFALMLVGWRAAVQ